MTDSNLKKPFALDVGQTSFTMRDLQAPQIRDQDNSAPKPQPPQAFRIDNPRLAPPGMKGIMRTVRPGQNLEININVNMRMDQPTTRECPPSPKERLSLGQQGKVQREFRPLAHRDHSRGYGR